MRGIRKRSPESNLVLKGKLIEVLRASPWAEPFWSLPPLYPQAGAASQPRLEQEAASKESSCFLPSLASDPAVSLSSETLLHLQTLGFNSKSMTGQHDERADSGGHARAIITWCMAMQSSLISTCILTDRIMTQDHLKWLGTSLHHPVCRAPGKHSPLSDGRAARHGTPPAGPERPGTRASNRESPGCAL